MDTENSSIALRLRAVRVALGLTQKDLAESVGSNLRTWVRYESGERTIPGTLIASIVQMGISANWLLTGMGPMFLSDGGASPVLTLRCLDEPEVPLSPEARRALEEDQMVRNTVEMLSEMAPEQRREICRYAEKEKLLTELLRERGGQAG